ncbi:MAG: hypothetical protein ACRBCK_09605 [Alphaproteobacteria bacterium]
MSEWVQKWTEHAQDIIEKLNNDTFDDAHQASGMNDAQLAVQCLEHLCVEDGTDEVILNLLDELEVSVGDDFYDAAVSAARTVHNDALIEKIEEIAETNTDYTVEASVNMSDDSFSL